MTVQNREKTGDLSNAIQFMDESPKDGEGRRGVNGGREAEVGYKETWSAMGGYATGRRRSEREWVVEVSERAPVRNPKGKVKV